MKKLYYIMLMATLFFSAGTFAQDGRGIAASKSETIDGLNIYPNPVSSGRVFITSKSTANKEVEIFDVLGKRILKADIAGKELNISILNPGVYIIKIKEGDASATRKLIVK
ncbi:MAG: T9SS type A sorting domain-containing protein [Flavobacterium sp.]|nr:MAG: T9SS type A sorting domain-containing protein [Flavobacterium sp.]